MFPHIGYALREQNRYILDDPSITGVELTFERADDPLRIQKYIQDLDIPYVSVHALKLSPGSPDLPSNLYLEALRAIAEENGAQSISDHLGFTRSGKDGAEIGHFAPVPMTQAALDTCSRNLEHIVNYFDPLHFYIENVAYLFALEGDMEEADFLSQVLSRSGCGWLLDVTNVYANALNFGFDGYEFIERVMPHADKVQFHLAGGFYDEKMEMYIDSHSHPLPDGVWDLYRHSLKLGGDKVGAIFIERDQNFPDENGWREEAGKVKTIAEEVLGIPALER